jgi:exodeoxyribonuclease V gamma subunit
VLHVHRSERADGLAGALAFLLTEPLGDPFAPEVVSVPTRGMERWLTQRLSCHLGAGPGRSDGVCANVAFPSPHRLVGEVIATASGVDPQTDPWLPERSAWPLLEVVEASLYEPWLTALATHLLRSAGEEGEPRARRLGTVRHVAELFDRYALHRPAMVRAWAGGQDSDGEGGPLAPHAAWQAELWRRLRARIGIGGPAERLDSACRTVAADASVLELPPRLSLFGLTRLPAGHLHVLRAVAHTRDVHLFLLHPSPAIWDALAQASAERPRHARGPIVRRRDDATAELPSNRLLASWGRDSREMQLVLSRIERHADHHHAVPGPAAGPSAGPDGGQDPVLTSAPGKTLLTRIQHDVHADRQPPGAPPAGQQDARPPLHAADRSVQVHACHGRARQVEVLRDTILHLLADDPSLEPRDVIVMCPDIETFAPLIQATFGAGETALPGEEQLGNATIAPDLRVRLADRALRQTNPVLGAVADLLDLVPTRMTASQVLDFADREPVRRRFRFDDDDLARLQGWISDSGIRWGLDAAHREPFSLQRFPEGTWRFGLDRVLLGVTMTEDDRRLFARVLPLDDVDSGAIDLAGRFAELVVRLGDAADACARPKPVAGWAAAIARAADMLTATGDRDAWQRAELQRLLDDLAGEATAATPGRATADPAPAGDPTPITLAEVRGLLAERLQGRPTRANFRTGNLTVCTLMPMRSVPHRVVCLLGLDDEVFPRKGPRDGDDLTLVDPHVGERDQRSEDRQMLLDALLAAGERLIITYTAADERTNAHRPPAVPVGELLDIVDATVRTEGDGGPARDRVIVRHPLQPFDPRNFTRGALIPVRSWSFDPVMREGAQALTGGRTERPPFLPGPLPPPPNGGLVEVEDLVRFVQHPMRAFLRRRLGISVSEWDDEIEDSLRVELDGLKRWGVGDRILDARLAGVEERDARLAEIARGTLPPGILGKPVIQQLRPVVEGIVSETRAVLARAPAPGSVDVRVTLPDGRSVRGTVPGVSGEVLCLSTYSRIAAKHRLSTWVRLLALTASRPDHDYTAATIGRAGNDDGGPVAVARIGSLGGTPAARRETALEQLAVLVDLHDRGMREPLPLYCATSAAYAAAAAAGAAGVAGAAGGDPVKAAAGKWTSGWKFDGEDREPEHVLVLGGEVAFEELLHELPRSEELGPGWESLETTRLGRLALRLWSGLLAYEQVSTA